MLAKVKWCGCMLVRSRKLGSHKQDLQFAMFVYRLQITTKWPFM